MACFDLGLRIFCMSTGLATSATNLTVTKIVGSSAEFALFLVISVVASLQRAYKVLLAAKDSIITSDLDKYFPAFLRNIAARFAPFNLINMLDSLLAKRVALLMPQRSLESPKSTVRITFQADNSSKVEFLKASLDDLD